MQLPSLSSLAIIAGLVLLVGCARNNDVDDLSRGLEKALAVSSQWNDHWSALLACDKDRDCALRRIGAIESIHGEIDRILIQFGPKARALCNRGEEYGCSTQQIFDRVESRIQTERKEFRDAFKR